jgi:glutaredoxin
MNRVLLIVSAALLAGPAFAQYKVVGPDGRITYTDRPPPAATPGGQVSGVRGSAAANSATAALPYELQQAVARFPVVFYTSPECSLCDTARRMLRQRGIPLTERQAQHPDDLALVERQTGGRGLPALMVGTQAVHGYGEAQWGSLLDLAGYPRQSKLPRDYAAAAPVPLSPRSAAPSPAPAPAVPAPAPEPPAPPAGDPPPIRF